MTARLVTLSLFLCAGLFAPVATAASCCEEKTLEELVLEDPDALVKLPRTGENPKGHGPVYAQGVVASLEGLDAVLKYVREAMLFNAPSVRMRVGDTVKQEELSCIVSDIDNVTGARCTEAYLSGGELMLRMTYDERARVMGLYRRFVDGSEEAWYYEGPLYSDYVDTSSFKDKKSGSSKRSATKRTSRQKSRSSSTKKSGSRRSNPVQKNTTAAWEDPVDTPPEFDSLRDLCCYVISAMPYCPEQLNMDFSEKLDLRQQQVVLLASKAHNKSTGGCGRQNSIGRLSVSLTQAKKSGGAVVTLNVQPGEHDLLLSSYLGLMDVDRLKDNQKEALEIITSMVENIKTQHPMEYHQALAVHDANLSRCTYEAHCTFDMVVDMVKEGTGKVSAFSSTSALMMSMLGIENTTGTGVEIESGSGHYWNYAYVDGVMGQIDSLMDDIDPDAEDGVSHKYVFQTDDERSQKFRWDSMDTPACTDNSLNEKVRFATAYPTVEAMVETMLGKRKGAEEPVLLEGTVQELSERPERVYELVRSALSKHGWGEKVEVDYTLHGGVTLFCE